MLRFALILGLSWLAASPVFAAGTKATVGACQLDKAQDVSSWPFETQYVKQTASWTATKSASDLLLAQTQYFSGKSSPFMRSSMPAELAFYEPEVRFQIQPFVTYSRTIDGRVCAKVVGAKLVVTHAATIHLARELAERSCVSRAALSHQLVHDQATKLTIEAILADKEEVKKQVFATYEKQGAAGRDQAEVAKQLETMEKSAVRAITERATVSIRANRKQHVETAKNFQTLYGSCNGEFEKASQLAEKR